MSEEIDKIYLTDIEAKHVRHLRDIHIPMAKNEMKHLLFIGRNGSGKTSVLDAISSYFEFLVDFLSFAGVQQGEDAVRQSQIPLRKQMAPENEETANEKDPCNMENMLEQFPAGLALTLNCPNGNIRFQFELGKFILGYYKTGRTFQADASRHVEKVKLKDNYKITESTRQNFIKYLVDLKMTEALALIGGKKEKAGRIKNWFANLERLLGDLFGDQTLRLIFDEDDFSFYISERGKAPFDFNTLSSGYAAILDIVADLILRMEKHTNHSFRFDLPGIVLIDEVEIHLHLELQKKILPLLTTLFPNIQFIVSTQSTLVMNSLSNVVIYDLTTHTLVEKDLCNVSNADALEAF